MIGKQESGKVRKQENRERRMTMIQAVAFDLDGTLLHTLPDIAAALNRALAETGLPTHPMEAVAAFIGGGIREAVIKASPPGTPEETINRTLTCYHRAYTECCTSQTAPYPGIPAMLRELAAAGYLLGALSNKTEAAAQKIIRYFFPETPFRCILGRIDGRPLKPDPAAAVPLLQALGLPPEAVLYMGDSGSDMAFARAVGMTPLAAFWGYRNREELISQGAALIADTPADVVQLIQEYHPVS